MYYFAYNNIQHLLSEPVRHVSKYGISNSLEQVNLLYSSARSFIRLHTWDFVEHFQGDSGCKFSLILHDEPPERHLDGSGETGREQISW